MAGTLKIRIGCVVMLLALAGCAASPTQRLVKTVAQQQRAEQAYRGGHPEQALADYQALVQQLPQNADFWFRLGNVYVRLDRPDDAVDAYQHVLRIEPGHAKAWHNLGIVRLRQAEAAFAQGAQHAAGIDAGLQRDSAAMAHGIAALGGAAPDTPASSTSAPPPPAAGRRP